MDEKQFAGREKFVSYSEKAVLRTFEVSFKNVNKKSRTIFFEAILGGIFIAIAYIVAIFVAIGTTTSGIKSLLMGLVFPIGLFLVTFVGGCLYTSLCVGFLNARLKNVKYSTFFKTLVIAYCGNAIGTLIGAILVLIMGLIIPLYNNVTIDSNNFAYEVSNTYIKKMWYIGTALQAQQYELSSTLGIGTQVTAQGFFATFFANMASAIFCNILIGATMYVAYISKTVTAAFLLILFSIMAFIIGGFQHSVANAFLFWVSLFQSFDTSYLVYNASNLNSSITNTYLSLNGLVPWYFLASNIIPSIIGNFIGGGIILPFGLYLIFKDKVKTFSKQLLLEQASQTINTVKDTIKEIVKP